MGVTTEAVVVGGRLEEQWFRAVNHLARVTPWLHQPARWFAEYGVVLFAAVLLAGWLLTRRTGDLGRVSAALWAPVGVLVAVGVNQLVAAAVAEDRPYAAIPTALVLVPRSTDPSFPSDHAVMAGAVAAGVLLAHRRLGIAATALALLMAATRVYVGAHFPLDVVAGLALGAAAAWASYLVVRRPARHGVRTLSRTPLRPLVTAQPREVLERAG